MMLCVWVSPACMHVYVKHHTVVYGHKQEYFHTVMCTPFCVYGWTDIDAAQLMSQIKHCQVHSSLPLT